MFSGAPVRCRLCVIWREDYRLYVPVRRKLSISHFKERGLCIDDTDLETLSLTAPKRKCEDLAREQMSQHMASCSADQEEDGDRRGRITLCQGHSRFESLTTQQQSEECRFQSCSSIILYPLRCSSSTWSLNGKLFCRFASVARLDLHPGDLRLGQCRAIVTNSETICKLRRAPGLHFGERSRRDGNETIVHTMD